jgi:RNA polymerase sigma-70 factor, ECF subfamily
MGVVELGMTDDASHANVARLVALARQGDASARDQLLTKYRSYLRLLAWQRLPKFVSKRTDGSDVVQQTLVDAVRGLPDFRGDTEGEFTAWMLRLLDRNLLQIARVNTAEKRDIRRETPDRNGESSAQLIWHSLRAKDSSPHGSVLRGETALQLAQALDRLPEDQRAAVEMRYLGQQSLRAIADDMQRTVSSVAGLIRRGVEALEAHLPAELGELS